jgi:ATP-binding cassette subfamily B multidrug efflux pump
VAEHMEDDVVGKAYDSRLMRRLLSYLLPYWRSVLMALLAIVVNAVLQLAPPYLTKLAIDEHIANRDLEGLVTIAWLYVAVLCGSFALEYVQTWLMQLTGQRIMYDLRMEIYSTCGSTTAIPSVA